MKRITVLALVCGCSLNAAALKGVDDGHAWNKAGKPEREALALKITQQSKAIYPAPRLTECLDAFFAPSAPATQREQEIISAAIFCDARLKRETVKR